MHDDICRKAKINRGLGLCVTDLFSSGLHRRLKTQPRRDRWTLHGLPLVQLPPSAATRGKTAMRGADCINHHPADFKSSPLVFRHASINESFASPNMPTGVTYGLSQIIPHSSSR
ncbi:hypothetical protein ElyMa_006101500 [Elysia marginata]|uniref:Uncharacterized protein n=1 Tax=Elysia marginata TaxID=1093978 RepID=A0AAV4GT42_9GAST|nr:hypothetical protein ElyMa_006101500 [Elysia marginata]